MTGSQVLEFAGIIEVPMFDTGVDLSPLNINNLWNELYFANGSYVPMLPATVGVIDNDHGGGPNNISAAVIPAVGGIGYSYWSKNPNAYLTPGNRPQWFDDRLFWQNGSVSNDPLPGSGTFFFANARVPRTPGDYASNTFNPQASWSGPNTPNILGSGPGWLGNIPVQALVVNDSSQVSRVGYYDYLQGSVVIDLVNWVLPFPFARQGTGITFQPNRGPQGSAVTDALYISGGVTGQNKIITYAIIAGSLSIAEANAVNIDNPTLDFIWQSSGGLGVSIYYGGYIISLGTNGTGPTGQLNEWLVTDPFMTTYYLLKFVPMDHYSEAILNLAGTFPTVQIDTDGIIWMGANSLQPGFKSRAIYSFSRTSLTPPTIQNPILSPIVLPCWNNCNPVLTI